MPSIKQVEQQIFAKEGFRVTLTALDPKTKSLPAYDYEYMASNRWTLNDWQASRMARYVPYARSVEVFRGTGERAKTTTRLSALRDTYFAAFCAEELAAAK
jgi:hypothetical protein